MWPIKKMIGVGGRKVAVSADKTIHNNSTVIEATATVASLTYAERWSLPHNNHEYSQEQAQSDFEAFLNKVAREALGRVVAYEVSESLQ